MKSKFLCILVFVSVLIVPLALFAGGEKEADEVTPAKTGKPYEGITVVMVSHDINLAAMYGDNLLLLKNGAIESKGPPSAVITQDTLKKAYGCELLLDESPVGEFPRITLIPGKYSE